MRFDEGEPMSEPLVAAVVAAVATVFDLMSVRSATRRKSPSKQHDSAECLGGFTRLFRGRLSLEFRACQVSLPLSKSVSFPISPNYNTPGQ